MLCRFMLTTMLGLCLPFPPATRPEYRSLYPQYSLGGVGVRGGWGYGACRICLVPAPALPLLLLLLLLSVLRVAAAAAAA